MRNHKITLPITASDWPTLDSNMVLKRSERSGVVILRLTGALDHQEMAGIKNEVNDLLSRGKKNVVLNLKGVSRASMMNIGVLVEQMRVLRSRGGDLKLVGMGPGLCDVFNRLGANKLFCLFSNDKDALNDFAEKDN